MSTTQFNEMFARNLRYFMDLNNMTQAELSRRLDVSESTVHSWLNAQRTPRMNRVDQMCALFGINRSDLITNDSTKEDLDHYYYDIETRDIADAISKDSELKLLFSAARDASPEDLKTVHEMLKALKRKELRDD
ncbi:MAG: helix-turn-helix transcriptional regulator [Clostridiaceae bacterium]|nr:helix-turn-helix transcriptional regulator [Clostridiaceae bacterium]